MIDIESNPGAWSEEGRKHFWEVYAKINQYIDDGAFHHPDWAIMDDFTQKTLNNTIAWNSAWIAANVYDKLDVVPMSTLDVDVEL